MNDNFAMLFEKTVEKVFGKPKTSIYFAGYYDINKQTYRSILLVMCIYEKNYNPITILRSFYYKGKLNSTSFWRTTTIVW